MSAGLKTTAYRLAAELFPDGKVVEEFRDEDALVLNIDTPDNAFELEQLYVWPDGTWESS